MILRNLKSLIRRYPVAVAICYVIAAPVGWLVVRYYLQQFSHRVGFLPSVFLLALVIVGCYVRPLCCITTSRPPG